MVVIQVAGAGDGHGNGIGHGLGCVILSTSKNMKNIPLAFQRRHSILSSWFY
jgi:hypothetical protein